MPPPIHLAHNRPQIPLRHRILPSFHLDEETVLPPARIHDPAADDPLFDPDVFDAIRQAFGVRWSKRIMPPQLRELMRHESIETTLKFYVRVNAEMTAETLWKAVSGDTLGDTAPKNTTIPAGK